MRSSKTTDISSLFNLQGNQEPDDALGLEDDPLWMACRRLNSQALRAGRSGIVDLSLPSTSVSEGTLQTAIAVWTGA